MLSFNYLFVSLMLIEFASIFLQKKNMKYFRFQIVMCFILILTSVNHVNAQRETDEKAYLNFKDGVGFMAPDSLFGMNIRFRMQNRIGFTIEDDYEDAEYEAVVKRCRLRFDGFIIDSKLTYYLQLSFSRGDQDWDNSHVPNVIRDAMVYYKFNKHFYIGLGQGKLPGNRQRVTSSGAQQFADRSTLNATFNIDRDFGLFGYYNTKIGNTMVCEIKGAVSSGDGRGSLKTDNGLAYTGRLEFLPFGKFTNKGDYFEGDLEREPSPKLSIAGSYSLDQGATKNSGTRGIELFEQRDIESFFADIAFKYNGWCFLGEFAQRNCTNPITYNSDSTSMVYVQTGSGFNAQLSYLFNNKIELAGRYTFIDPSVQMIGLTMPQQHIGTMGITKYIFQHKAKIQFNLSRIFQTNTLLIDDKTLWNAMFQIEIGI